jgi:hypothetical protein
MDKYPGGIKLPAVLSGFPAGFTLCYTIAIAPNEEQLQDEER